METKEKTFLFLALIFLILLRLPSLADPKYYLDEGVYLSVAYEISQGGTLYQTAWDLKPPGIFYIYLFFQKIFGPHAFLAQRAFNLILGALGVWGVYRLAKLLKATTRVATTSAFLAAIFLGMPFFETQIFNTENIFIVTSLLAFIFGLKFKNRWQEPFVAGFLFAAGQWFKIHPLFDLTAFGIFALCKFKFDRKFWLPFVAGLATPLLVLLWYLLAKGIFFDFIETNLSYNLFYVEELPQITFFGNLLMRTLLLIAMAGALVFLKFKNKISESTFLLSLWFVFVFYGALLSARTYGHYFIPVLIPTTLLIARFASLPIRQAGPPGLAKALVAALIILLFLTPSLKHKMVSEQAGFYQVRLSYIFGKISEGQFEENFTPKPWRLRDLKNYLDENVATGEQVYLWGNSPWAPYVLQRRPVQRFLMWFHILGIKEREEEVYQTLLSKMPEIIIVEDEWPEGESHQISRPPFPKLQRLIDTNYRLETKVAGYHIYRPVKFGQREKVGDFGGSPRPVGERGGLVRGDGSPGNI